VSNYIRASIRKVSFILCLISVADPANSARLTNGSDELTASPAIVIGFVGGFVRCDAMQDWLSGGIETWLGAGQRMFPGFPSDSSVVRSSV
jgi:hypothetical protein